MKEKTQENLFIGVLVSIPVCLGLIAGLLIVHNHTGKTTTNYALEDMGSGVYIRTGQVVSAIPAENYTVATILIDGTLYTVKGKVIVHISKDHRATWTKSRMKNDDVLEAYVPHDGIEYGSLTQTWQ